MYAYPLEGIKKILYILNKWNISLTLSQISMLRQAFENLLGFNENWKLKSGVQRLNVTS